MYYKNIKTSKIILYIMFSLIFIQLIKCIIINRETNYIRINIK